MKSKIISRRQLLIGTLTAALCLAVFVNWYYTKPKGLEEPQPEITSTANLGEAQYVNGTNTDTDYFGTAKLNRTKAHDNAKDHLESIIADSEADEEAKKQAREKLIGISSQLKTEADIENLITAQLKNDCLVTLGDDNVEVILPKGAINEEILIKIKNIVISKTTLTAENITIIELK